MRKISKYFVFGAVFLLSSMSFAAPEKGHPNIVLIFADDLGYGDVGCYGATKVKTPNIDQLAKEGRRFTDAHSASAVCTPSRYALLTGEYPSQANDGRGIWGPCHPNSRMIIDPDRFTIGKLLQNKNYETSCFGKWHLGFGADEKNDWQEPLRPGPQDLGFDYYFGVPVVNSAPPYVYVENDRIVGMTKEDPLVYLGGKSEEATPITPLEVKHGNRVPNWFGGAVEAHKLYNDFSVGTTLAERACQWISERDDDPFFLYLSTTNIHHPCTPAAQFQGTSECGLYGDFIHELDWMVGEVVKALEAKGVADNTLVLFTSDNGGMFNENGQDTFTYGHQINGDLLGFKFGAWEGGHRVPFIAKWPGKIEAGSTSDQLVSNIDMLATFAALTDQSLSDEQQADSVNILPALVGNPEEQVRKQLILAPYRSSHLSLRRGKWMFIDAQGSGGFGGAKPGGHGFAGPAAASFVGKTNSDVKDGRITPGAPPAQLYDLEADFKQTKNVYYDNLEIAEEMRAMLKEYAPKKARPQTAVETKYDNFKPVGNLRFTFESGKLDDWKMIEGEAGLPVSDHASLPNHVARPFNHEGKFHLSTIATGEGFSDQQQVVFQSPAFVIEGERASFLASGGYKADSVYVGLVDAETKQVLHSAGGTQGPQMKRTTWDVSKLKGKTVYLQVVDKSEDGWGHLTFDDFSVEGKIVVDEKPQPKTPDAAAAPAMKSPASKGERLPNVVLIFADDLGYGDLGCYGATKLETPNIDKLAAEGRRFTDAHSASAVCTPSRYGLLTGEYPFRAKGGKGIWGPCSHTQPLLIDTNKLTLGELFKNKGYATAAIGKWHLGFGETKTDWNKPLRPGPLELGGLLGMAAINAMGSNGEDTSPVERGAWVLRKLMNNPPQVISRISPMVLPKISLSMHSVEK